MKRKIRTELIYSKLKELNNSIFFIEEFLPADVKDLEDRGARNKLYKEVEFAIQLMIDICSVINSDVSKETPSDEDSIFISLKKENVISPTLTEKIQKMKGFRNLLVHRYGEIDNEEAYESISSGLKDFDLFVKEIEKFLEKHKTKKSKG